MEIKCICKWCGKEFKTNPSAIKHGRGKFCSRKCQGKYRSKYLKGKNNANWKGKIKRICLICGKEFEVYPHKIKLDWGKFCSRECQSKWQSEHIKGENHPLWKPKIKRMCVQCGKSFEVYPYKIKLGEDRFCSKKCYSEWQSIHQRGENSIAWRGGISFEPYCHKFNFAFKEYIRDKFSRICFLCPKTEEENGQRLSVHHVNYDKGCMCNDNLTCQFVPLCRSCNAKVNKNRKEWEAKINDMLHNKLNGWYI